MADNPGGSRLKRWDQQAAQPAAPYGQQQAARAAQGYQQQDPQYAGSRLGKWTSENGYVDQAQRWYTGANQDGTNNGWDNQFAKEFIEGQDKAANEGRLGSYFADAESTKATGVVTWDHEKDGKTFTFGDVYEKGQFKGNIYDQFDKADADLMMSDWLFDGKTKAKIFGASDNVERLASEIADKRARNETEIPKSIKAMEFQGKVDDREKAFRSGIGVDEAIPLATAAGGAAVGSVFGPGGTAVGFGVGLVGGYLNKDNLTEQAARAYEITALSTKENGLASGIFEGVHQWSGVAGRSITPFSNLVQGGFDAATGKVGDGTSEFYRVDKAGDRKAPSWMQAADVAATIGDSFLQFASPLGATLYMGQMSSTILGETGSLILSGGETFDDRQGDFDNIFKDDKGNLDLGAAAAGIGQIGIDVVQLGFSRGLVGKADSSLTEAGKSSFYGTGGMRGALPQWAGGYSKEAKDVLAAGGKVQEVAGKRILLDSTGKVAKNAEGKAILNRPTLSLLAPSEQLTHVSAKAIARREAAKRGGAVEVDDFLKAAHSMASGERKLSSALINGLGEGYEEAIQAVLEPLSHNANFTGEEVWRGFVGGFGAGTGMTLATNLRGGSADDKLFEQARLTRQWLTGGQDLTKAEWRAMNPAAKRALSSPSGVDAETMSAAYKIASDDMKHTMVGGVVEETRLRDIIEQQTKTSLQSLTNKTDQPLVMTGVESTGVFDPATGEADLFSMPSDAVGSSGLQLLKNFTNRMRGLNTQQKTLARDIEAAKKRADEDPENAKLLEERDSFQRQADTLDKMLEWGVYIERELRTQIEQMYTAGRSVEEDQADAAVVNMFLRDMFHEREIPLPGILDEITPGDRRAIARVVSQIVTRDPADSQGNYQVLVPQISARLTNERADNVVQISSAILPAIKGDYDGDKIRTLQQLILDDVEFINLRSGTQFIGTGTSVNVPAPSYEKWHIDILSKSLTKGNKAIANYATGTMVQIGEAVRNRYDGVVPDQTLDGILYRFYDSVKANDPEARKILLDGLASEAGGAITEFSRQNLSNEWLWLDQVVRSHLQQFQKMYAAHNPEFNGGVDTSDVAVNKQSPVMKTVQQDKAATLGATLGLLLPGESMFRKFQDLHYIASNNSVLSAEWAGDREQLAELAQLYAAIGSGATVSALDNLRAKDEITGNVLARLEAFAEDAVRHYADQAEGRQLNKSQAMVVLANIAVLDVSPNAKGEVYTRGNKISLAQLLLKQEIAKDKVAKQQVLEVSPELQAKHARLEALTVTGGHGGPSVPAQRAFVEIFGSMQMYDLMGDDSAPFGAYLTVEQWMRQYTAKDEIQRRSEAAALRKESPYLDRKSSKDLPYGTDEIEQISAYRSVVDSLIAAGNARDAEQAARSDSVTANFTQAHADIRVAIRKYEDLSPRRDGESAEMHFKRLMDTHPDFAREVMALVTANAGRGVFRLERGKIFAADWVYRTFTLSDAKEAEMHYWRNILKAEIKAFDISRMVSEEGSEGEHGRNYDHLPRRMHRIIYSLSRRGDGDLLLAKFIKQMEKASDLSAFMEWVNTTPGIRGSQAPIVAWVDDVAEFDADKAQGGWTTQLGGAELREAVASLKTSSQRLVKSLSEEGKALQADISTIRAIERVWKYDNGDTSIKLDRGDRQLYDQTVAALEQSGELLMGHGPQAMVYQTIGAARGYYEKAHSKGVNPGNIRPQGAFDAMSDAMGFLTGYERFHNSLTTVGLDAVGNSMEQVSKDGGRSMDDFGRIVEWEKFTVPQFIAWMSNPDTRPAARAILFPQVMERTAEGGLRAQLLVDKDLASFLDGSTLRDMFPKGDYLSKNRALKYISMLEAQARAEGGQNSVQRAVNDIVIARLTAATQEMAEEDLEALTVETYVEFARAMQTIGAVSDAPTEEGADPLDALFRNASEVMRTKYAARTLGLEDSDEQGVEYVLDAWVKERTEEFAASRTELAAMLDADITRADEINLLTEAVNADEARFLEQMQNLRSNDELAAVVDMFTFPTDKKGAALKKSQLVDYINTHHGKMSNVTSVTMTLRQLTAQLRDKGRGGQIDLSDKQWDELSRAAISVYLSEVAGRPTSGASLAMFPDADHKEDRRYFDTSFTYLMKPMLDSTNPVVKAARALNGKAGRLADALPEDVIDVLSDTIYADFALGTWTEDVPRFSIEANSRLDSASAEPGISIPGKSPMRQAVKSAAYRRTFERPDESLLSTASLAVKNLGLRGFENIMIAKPGMPGEEMSIAQLNNRFAQSATVTFTNGDTVELLSTTEAGHRWFGGGDINETVANSGYFEMHLERLEVAVTAAALERGLSPTDGIIDIKFFHPDSQPAGADWYNNIYFEGTSFKLDADQHASLNESLWFALGGINPLSQQTALDASKKGLPALQAIKTLTNSERKTIETDWATSLSSILRTKTRLLMQADLGGFELEPEFYNAVYKDLKGKHFVRGTSTETGEAVLLDAETVIALQEAGEELGLENAELWIPSDEVLRSMLGEQGGEGISRLYPDQIEFDLTRIPRYRGVTTDMLTDFALGVAGDRVGLQDTRVTARAHQSQLVIRDYLNAKELSAFKIRMKYLDTIRTEIDNARGENRDKMDTRAQLKRTVEAAGNMLSSENIAFDMNKVGIPFAGPRKFQDIKITELLLSDIADIVNTEQPNRTGWIYAEDGPHSLAEGTLSASMFASTGEIHRRIAPGDLVVVQLDRFEGNTKLMQQRLDYLQGRGAVIIFGSADGSTSLFGEARTYLEGTTYEHVAGSRHAYQPADLSTRYQNQRARASALLETRGVSKRNMMAALLTQDKSATEGMIWVRPGDERLGAITATDDLLVVNAMVTHNVPASPDEITSVREHLRGFRSKEDRKFLEDMAVGNITDPNERLEAAAKFNEDFDALLRQFDSNDGSVLPGAGDMFRRGSIVPLISNTGDVLLYRHGLEGPNNYDEVRAMQALPRESGRPGKVAIYSAKINKAATVHEGEVLEIRPRGQYGMEIEQNISQQIYGMKIQLEWNGMKYTAVPMPDDIVLPEHGFFKNWSINGVSDLDSLFSKDAYDGLVNNHRNAFAYFGIDFTDDVATFLYPDFKSMKAEQQNQARIDTKRFLRAVSSETHLSYADADEIINAANIGASYTELMQGFSASASEAIGIDPSWLGRMNEPTVEAQIATAMIVYLSTRGADVSHVLQSGGFNDDSPSPDAQSRLMPRLFTQVFDNSQLDSELRTEMNRRFNQQLFNPNGSNTGYRLLSDWTFQVLNENPEDNLSGMLQISEAHASDDNPVTNGMSFDETENQTVSQHSAAIAQQAIGARTSSLKEIMRSKFFATGDVTHFEEDQVDGGLWRMMTGFATGDGPASAWREESPAEVSYRALGRAAMVQFRQPIDKTETTGWTPEQIASYRSTAQEIMRALRLKENQWEMVDGWVRQQYGKPQDLVNAEDVEISGKQAIEIAELFIKQNVDNKYLPTMGAQVPYMDVQDLQMIFRANRDNRYPWNPRESMDANSTNVTTWDGWVEVALDDSFMSTKIFDPMFRLATDGFMHTYQNATRSLLDLPVSIDPELTGKLIDPETNKMIISLDPNVNQLTMDPALFDIARAGINELMGGQRIAGQFVGKYPPNSELAKQMAARKRWRLENDVPIPVEMTMKNLRKNGAAYIQRGTEANSVARILINLRIGTALINPALWFSMGPEAVWRGAIDRASNILTGQATAGIIARRQAGLSERIMNQQVEILDPETGEPTGETRPTKFAEALEAMGLTVAYTPAQLKKLGRLYDVMGERTAFKAMVYSDLNFQRPHQELALSKIEKASAAYARFGTRVQDPTWGVRGKTLARKYMEAAMQYVASQPTVNNISTDTLIAEMENDPLFLQKNFPEAHKAASASIAQSRSLKPTVASLFARGIYEPLSTSSNPGVNFASNVLLKMPLLFSGYAFNVVTTITGMQGFNDVFAMFLDQKEKPTWIRRIQSAMRGDEFDPEQREVFDMSEVLEGLDLSRSFIRGGLTHSGLFAMGMMAGGLGLTGEDDEERRRRRAAELQGAGFVYDPRRLENDFRNADAIYFGGTAFQMPWVAKQFISPIIGMERFFDTGDFRQVTWGFTDAIGSFPIINSLMLHDAVETAQDFVGDADEAAKDGQPKVANNALISAVGTYERMLFENSFVNQLYQASDRYDRDPYAQPLLDSDEDTQVDAMGQPREADEMREYIDEDGNIKQGYVARSGASAKLHQLTENRATMAGALSLFTGLGGSSFFRQNMVVKTRTFDAPVSTNDQTKAVVRALMETQGAAANLTQEEAMNVLRNQGVGGTYARNSDLEPLAKQYAKEQGYAPLSYLDNAGREQLTTDGRMRVFQSLAKGSVAIGDASLKGIHVTKEQRDQIANEWTKELVQEGVDMGLDQTKATARMKRLMYGPFDDPSVQGLADILYDPAISYTDKLEYNQLNTTYTKGPDGRPWATGFGRSAWFGAIKPEKLMEPDKGFDGGYTGVMSIDDRFNSVDLANQQNLGLRGLEPTNPAPPTDKEIGEAIEKAIAEASTGTYTPMEPFAKSGGGGGFGGFGGGGGGGGYSPNIYFSKMDRLPESRAPYSDSIPFINTSNPILRRADVRRERVWSERGRLKQWQ